MYCYANLKLSLHIFNLYFYLLHSTFSSFKCSKFIEFLSESQDEMCFKKTKNWILIFNSYETWMESFKTCIISMTPHTVILKDVLFLCGW